MGAGLQVEVQEPATPSDEKAVSGKPKDALRDKATPKSGCGNGQHYLRIAWRRAPGYTGGKIYAGFGLYVYWLSDCHRRGTQRRNGSGWSQCNFPGQSIIHWRIWLCESGWYRRRDSWEYRGSVHGELFSVYKLGTTNCKSICIKLKKAILKAEMKISAFLFSHILLWF